LQQSPSSGLGWGLGLSFSMDDRATWTLAAARGGSESMTAGSAASDAKKASSSRHITGSLNAIRSGSRLNQMAVA
jgi:hypothetical protein